MKVAAASDEGAGPAARSDDFIRGGSELYQATPVLHEEMSQ
jgi:hypothetical protein